MSAKLLLSPVIGAALAIAVVTGPTDANACECDNAAEVLPGSGATVASNTKIWITDGYGCETPVVRDASGEAVYTRTDTIGGGYRVLTPTTELQVGETYSVYCEASQSYADSTFSVSDGPDDEPPTIPSVTASETDSSSGGSSCGEWNHVEMNVTWEGDVLLLDIAGQANIDPATLNGSVVDVFSGFFYEGSVFIGTTACDANWSFDEDGDAPAVRWASFDFSGNFSGWSPPQDVSDGCGCRLVASRTGKPRVAWLGVSLGALAWLRARRAPRRRPSAKQRTRN